MAIRRLSYVTCDVCGDPGQPADDAKEARAQARVSDAFVRVGGRDLCQRHRPDRPTCPEHPDSSAFVKYGHWYCSTIDCHKELGEVGRL